MGNKYSCCAWRGSRRSLTDSKTWTRNGRGGGDCEEFPGNDSYGGYGYANEPLGREESGRDLQHISEREPDDMAKDPSVHPSATTLFIERSKKAIESE